MAHDQYADKTDLKNMIGLSGTSQDNNIDNAINAACRQIDKIVGRVFYETETTQIKYFNPVSHFYLQVPDISKTTSLEIKLDTNDDGSYDTTLVENTDFYLLPLNPKQIGKVSSTLYYEPYTEIRILDQKTDERFDPTIIKNVKITAFWGFSMVPDAIKQATLLQASRLWKRKDSPFSTYGNIDTGEQELFQKFDPDARNLIMGYKKRTL